MSSREELADQSAQSDRVSIPVGFGSLLKPKVGRKRSARFVDAPLRAISLRFPTVVVSRLMSRRTTLRSVRNSKDFITRTVMTADVLGRARFVSVSSKPEVMMTSRLGTVPSGREHRPPSLLSQKSPSVVKFCRCCSDVRVLCTTDHRYTTVATADRLNEARSKPDHRSTDEWHRGITTTSHSIRSTTTSIPFDADNTPPSPIRALLARVRRSRTVQLALRAPTRPRTDPERPHPPPVSPPARR
jgi:hypothetical protein